MFDLNLKFYAALILIVYFPFHLFEEAVGDFPNWMKEHKWMPEKLSYGHWIANNVFFYYSILVSGFICFILLGDKFAFMGVGILIWGFINFLDHFIYTLLDRKKSPGLFTGLLYFIIFLLGLFGLSKNDQINAYLIIMSVIMGILYAFVPVLLSILLSKKFKKIFV